MGEFQVRRVQPNSFSEMELCRGWPFLIGDFVERSNGVCAILSHRVNPRFDQGVMGTQHFVRVERGVISKKDLIGRESGGGVDSIIVYRRGEREPVRPPLWVVRGDQSKVLLDPLVLS